MRSPSTSTTSDRRSTDGRQAGFHALTHGLESEEFLPLLEAACHDVLQATAVPAANEVQCGRGTHHSPEAAQQSSSSAQEWETMFASQISAEKCPSVTTLTFTDVLSESTLA